MGWRRSGDWLLSECGQVVSGDWELREEMKISGEKFFILCDDFGLSVSVKMNTVLAKETWEGGSGGSCQGHAETREPLKVALRLKTVPCSGKALSHYTHLDKELVS